MTASYVREFTHVSAHTSCCATCGVKRLRCSSGHVIVLEPCIAVSMSPVRRTNNSHRSMCNSGVSVTEKQLGVGVSVHRMRDMSHVMLPNTTMGGTADLRTVCARMRYSSHVSCSAGSKKRFFMFLYVRSCSGHVVRLTDTEKATDVMAHIGHSNGTDAGMVPFPPATIKMYVSSRSAQRTLLPLYDLRYFARKAYPFVPETIEIADYFGDEEYLMVQRHAASYVLRHSTPLRLSREDKAYWEMFCSKFAPKESEKPPPARIQALSRRDLSALARINKASATSYTSYPADVFRTCPLDLLIYHQLTPEPLLNALTEVCAQAAAYWGAPEWFFRQVLLPVLPDVTTTTTPP